MSGCVLGSEDIEVNQMNAAIVIKEFMGCTLKIYCANNEIFKKL